MKFILTITFLTILQVNGFSQDTFTSRKGSRFFPGHLDIVITVDSKFIRYELFNHWYSWSYAEHRQMTIPIDSINSFNESNDTIKIELRKNKVKLIDKKYHLTRNIRHKNICASSATMRKISFAYKISSPYKDIRHFHLYEREDLKLDEEEFKKKVCDNLDSRTK